LTLWGPGTSRVEGASVVASDRLETATGVGGQKRLALLAPETGTYYLEVTFVPRARTRLTYRLAVATR
jgi:hypothetical protein